MTSDLGDLVEGDSETEVLVVESLFVFRVLPAVGMPWEAEIENGNGIGRCITLHYICMISCHNASQFPGDEIQ